MYHEHLEKLDPHLAERVLVVASRMGNNVIGRKVTERLVTSLMERVGVASRPRQLRKLCLWLDRAWQLSKLLAR